MKNDKQLLDHPPMTIPAIGILTLFPDAQIELDNDEKVIIYTNETPWSMELRGLIPPTTKSKYSVTYTTEETYTGYVLAGSEEEAIQKAREGDWATDCRPTRQYAEQGLEDKYPYEERIYHAIVQKTS